MEKNLEKRYLLEIGYNSGIIADSDLENLDVATDLMYRKYQNGEVSFTYAELVKWLIQYRKNNALLGHKMRITNCIHGSGAIEIAIDEKSPVHPNQGTSSKANIMTLGHIGVIPPKTHLIIGDIIPNQLEIAKKVIDENGQLSMGYIGSSDSIYTSYILKQYRKMAEELKTVLGPEKGTQLYNREKNNSADGIQSYVLKYNAYPGFVKYDNSSKCYVSQR